MIVLANKACERLDNRAGGYQAVSPVLGDSGSEGAWLWRIQGSLRRTAALTVNGMRAFWLGLAQKGHSVLGTSADRQTVELN